MKINFLVFRGAFTRKYHMVKKNVFTKNIFKPFFWILNFVVPICNLETKKTFFLLHLQYVLPMVPGGGTMGLQFRGGGHNIDMFKFH